MKADVLLKAGFVDLWKSQSVLSSWEKQQIPFPIGTETRTNTRTDYGPRTRSSPNRKRERISIPILLVPEDRPQT